MGLLEKKKLGLVGKYLPPALFLFRKIELSLTFIS